MNDKITIREAQETETLLIQELVKEMATYERRPEDMTGTQEELRYWLFERKIATILLMEYEGAPIGYAIYYPIFGSFAAHANVHLEDLYIREEYRKRGLGRVFFEAIAGRAKEEGYAKMEWSCLDWNTPSIGFYEKIGAEYETGRKYFELSL
jgi:GNAT superfamily N-acetyltransferase